MNAGLPDMWFLLRVFSSLFFATSTIIDDFLVDNFKKTFTTLTLVVFSSVVAIIPAGVLLVLAGGVKNVFNLPWWAVGLLLLAGVGEFLSLWLYLHSLKFGEAVVSSVFYRLEPICVLIFACWFMGESLEGKQVVGVGLVLLATTLFTLSISRVGRVRFRKKQTLPMLMAVSLVIIETLVIKQVANMTGVSYTVLGFWQFFSLLMCGVGLMVFSRGTRKQLMKILVEKYPGKKKLLIAEGLNESFYLGALALGGFSNVIGNVSVSSVLAGLQPAIVFVISLGLWIWRPRVFAGDFGKWGLRQKIVGTILIVVGSALVV